MANIWVCICNIPRAIVHLSKVAPQLHGQMHPSTYIDGKHLLVYMFITKIIKY